MTFIRVDIVAWKSLTTFVLFLGDGLNLMACTASDAIGGQTVLSACRFAVFSLSLYGVFVNGKLSGGDLPNWVFWWNQSCFGTGFLDGSWKTLLIINTFEKSVLRVCPP